MSPIRLMVCTLATLALLTPHPQAARAQFTDMVKRVPGSTNTVILWNAYKVFGSPIAQREGWSKNYEKAFAAGMVRLPSDTRQFMAASQMDFVTMQPVWQISMITTTKPHSMASVAKLRKGTLTTIAGHPAVLLPENSYVIELGEKVYGSISPADRQAASRWVRDTESAQQLAPYIQQAIGFAENAGTEIIMAMDLQDVLSPERIKQAAQKSDAITQAKIDINSITPLLSGVQGVTLGITFADQPYGKIKVDFSADASILTRIAKPLFLEVLGNQGAMIDDLKEWTGQADEKQLTLSGYFTNDGMRKILSLIDEPATTAVADEATIQSASDVNPTVVASQKYFKSIDSVLRDLRNHDSPTTIYQFGAWFEKYANRIDRLPMVNVDEELIQYGTYVGQQLRNASAAIKGIGYQTRVGEIQAANSSGPGYYGNNYCDGGYNYNGYVYRDGSAYGGVHAYNFQAGLQAEQKARTQVQSQARVQGAAAARAIMGEIKNAERTMRVQMTEKYKVDF